MTPRIILIEVKLREYSNRKSSHNLVLDMLRCNTSAKIFPDNFDLLFIVYYLLGKLINLADSRKF